MQFAQKSQKKTPPRFALTIFKRGSRCAESQNHTATESGSLRGFSENGTERKNDVITEPAALPAPNLLEFLLLLLEALALPEQPAAAQGPLASLFRR